MNTRVRRELEPKWVSWYVSLAYPQEIVKLRCPLGPIPKELKKLLGKAKAIKTYRPWRPEVDAVIITKTNIVLIEAKIQKFMDGLSKLPVYESLVSTTPELQHYIDKPTKMILLMPARVEWVITASKKNNVQVVIESPEFIQKAYEDRDKYWTKPHMKKREQRKATLKRLGYE